MHRTIASIGRRVFSVMGLRLRSAALLENRFDAMGDALSNMVRLGFVPEVVVDGGANIGQWSTLASGIFPAAQFHLIEPQPGCWPSIEARFTAPRFTLHRTAVTSPYVSSVRMVSASADQRNTGAYVTAAGTAGATGETYPSTTLDRLIGPLVPAGARVLLKLDVEGHEISVLEGAVDLLPRVEVIVCEVAFFDINDDGGITFTDVLAFLNVRGFDLYDFAALAARRRDLRLRMGDAVFVRRGTPLLADTRWE